MMLSSLHSIRTMVKSHPTTCNLPTPILKGNEGTYVKCEDENRVNYGRQVQASTRVPWPNLFC